MRAGVSGHGHEGIARRILISGQGNLLARDAIQGVAIFEECYMPVKVALYIEDG